MSDFSLSLLDGISDGVYIVDRAQKIIFWSKGAERISGFSKEEVMGRFCANNILNHVDKNGLRLCVMGCPLGRSLRDGKNRKDSVFLHHKNGHRVAVDIDIYPFLDDGKIMGAVEIFRDTSNKQIIIDSENIEHDQLKILALYDSLTNIPNRLHVERFGKNAQYDYTNYDIPYGVIFADIDNFRTFNNDHGHEIGDKVLKMFAKSMAAVARPDDLIGRWGGEEFIAVIGNANTEIVEQAAEKMHMLAAHSYYREGRKRLGVTASFGATMAIRGESFAETVKRADLLMYKAKDKGKDIVG